MKLKPQLHNWDTPQALVLVVDTITQQKLGPVARGETAIGLAPQTLAPSDQAQLEKVEKTQQGPLCMELATLLTMVPVILGTIIVQIASLTTGPLPASILLAPAIPTRICQVTHRQSRQPEPTAPNT